MAVLHFAPARSVAAIHRVFDPARLDVEIIDRFGTQVTTREWFLVPLFVIDDAVDTIKDGTIADFVYEPSQAKLVIRRPG